MPFYKEKVDDLSFTSLEVTGVASLSILEQFPYLLEPAG